MCLVCQFSCVIACLIAMFVYRGLFTICVCVDAAFFVCGCALCGGCGCPMCLSCVFVLCVAVPCDMICVVLSPFF